MEHTSPIILLNGFPKSGKDSIAAIIGGRLNHMKFADPIHAMAYAVFPLTRSKWHYIYDHHKDEPSGILYGMTPREVFIWLAEKVIKPKFGQSFFAEHLANRIKLMQTMTDANQDLTGFVVSDLGFQEEFDTLAYSFGKERIHLWRVIREGTSPANDSRSIIKSSHALEENFIVIENDGSKLDLVEKVNFFLNKIL